jgi:DNA-binding LacI/PurR family transcriptional regulator
MRISLVKQICNDLTQQIVAGHLKPEDRIPSVNQLRNHYAASTGAILYAFKKLEKQGLIRSVHGKGTFVKTSPLNSQDLKSRDLVFFVTEEIQSASTRTREILRGAVKEAEAYRFHVLYNECDKNDAPNLKRKVLSLDNRPLLGLITVGLLTEEMRDLLQAASYPVVVTSDTNRSKDLISEINIVTSDLYGDTLQAIDHLVGLGHRNFGFITTVDWTPWGMLVREGMVNGLHGHGLEIMKEYDFSLRALDNRKGWAIGQDLAGQFSRCPSAIPTVFCIMSPSLIAGLIDGLHDRGLRVPEHCSICSLGGAKITDVQMKNEHQLSGIAEPWETLGRHAVRRLIELQKSPTSRIRQLVSGTWFEGTTVGIPRPKD